MSKYRKVVISTYGDQKFRELTAPPPCGRYLFLYLLTGPHTTAIPGLSTIGEAAMAEAIGWDLEGFRRAFAEISDKGMAEADWSARVIWLPNAIKYNPPESPNVIIGWSKAIVEIPECKLRQTAASRLKEHVAGMSKGFREAFREAFGKISIDISAKPSNNQEQEQEQEHEHEHEHENLFGGGGSNGAPLADPIVLTFETIPGARGRSRSWDLTRSKLAELQATFPGIAAESEAREAWQWLRDNANYRKTADGMPDYLRRWMKRAQNQSGGGGAATSGGRSAARRAEISRGLEGNSRR